jgi:translocation and assembly module TamB
MGRGEDDAEDAAAGGQRHARIVADADLGIAGTLQQWAAIGRATLTREGERAQVRFDGAATTRT